MRRAHGKWWLPWVIVFGIFSLAIPMLFRVVFRPFTVPTGAMAPTIRGVEERPDGTKTVGDHVFVTPCLYRFRAPARGDIVVFSTREIRHRHVPADTYYIKRIAGLPGDRVAIDPPYLVVNGRRVTEPAVFGKMGGRRDGYDGYMVPGRGTMDPPPWMSSTNEVQQLGPDEYLVLGDNSRSSLDSRYFGPIKRSAILGPVVFRYYPFNRAGQIH
jgi:signal peptidase I